MNKNDGMEQSSGRPSVDGQCQASRDIRHGMNLRAKPGSSPALTEQVQWAAIEPDRASCTLAATGKTRVPFKLCAADKQPWR